MLSGDCFTSTSEALISAILKMFMLRDWNYVVFHHFQWHGLPAEFHKNVPVGWKYISVRQADERTGRQTGDRTSLPFIFKRKSVKTACRYMKEVLGSRQYSDQRDVNITFPWILRQRIVRMGGGFSEYGAVVVLYLRVLLRVTEARNRISLTLRRNDVLSTSKEPRYFWSCAVFSDLRHRIIFCRLFV
jgi:hypothetical protein